MKLPLTQHDSTRPIYFADGTLFSFSEHTAEIIAALNFVHDVATFGDSTMGHALIQDTSSVVIETLVEKAREIAGT